MPQYIMRTNKVEHAKRNGMVTIELANTKGRAPYRPLAVSFTKLARSSRTKTCWISFLYMFPTQVPTHIRGYLLLTLKHVHDSSNVGDTGTQLQSRTY
jgi:hypothetical protein